MCIFSYANSEGIAGEVLKIDVGKFALKEGDAGITGADDFLFVGDCTFKRSYAGILVGEAGLHFLFLCREL